MCIAGSPLRGFRGRPMQQNKQTHVASFVEITLSTAVGFVISLVTQILVFPLFGLQVSMGTNLSLTMVFTVISVIRGFVMRRVFEHMRVKGVLA
jgi:hypothetical protein